MCKHWVHNAFFLPVFFFFFLVFCFSRFCVSLVPIHQLCDECTSKIAEKLLHIGAYQSIIAFGGEKKSRPLLLCLRKRCEQSRERLLDFVCLLSHRPPYAFIHFVIVACPDIDPDLLNPASITTSSLFCTNFTTFVFIF